MRIKDDPGSRDDHNILLSDQGRVNEESNKQSKRERQSTNLHQEKKQGSKIYTYIIERFKAAWEHNVGWKFEWKHIMEATKESK